GAGASGSRSPAPAASTLRRSWPCSCWVGSQPLRRGMPCGPPRPALPRSRAWCGFSPPTTCSFPCIARCGRAGLKYSRSLSRRDKRTPEPPGACGSKDTFVYYDRILRSADVRRSTNNKRETPADTADGSLFSGGIHMARTRASFIRSLTISTAVAGFAGLPFVASAQQPDQGAIQEVVVTAQKREANLQDVPFSVSATSQDQIRNSGSENLIDLARN